MVLLYFALHLSTLSPPLLSKLKQCLLELSNLYALTPPAITSKRPKIDSSVGDRIGLCYFQRSSISSSDELKVAYSASGEQFSLRDFHYAVSHLPSDSYFPPLSEDSIFFDLNVSCLLTDELLLSAACKDIERKIVLISSCIAGTIDSNFRNALLDAADRCVSVEFLFFEQKSSQLTDISESINNFKGQLSDLENCSFYVYLSDEQVFNGLVKRWVGDLTDDTEKLLKAHLVFQKSIRGSINEISCRLLSVTNQVMDLCVPCKVGNLNQVPNLANKKCMKCDEHTFLTQDSWRCWKDNYEMSSAVYLNVIERTQLDFMNEGVVVGHPYIVLPSISAETDTTPEESEKCQLNNNLFQGLCRALHSLNQGLLCCSSCYIETMRETEFQYYYFLQPSDNGPMLLRRLAGAEEMMLGPDINESDYLITEEIENDIEQCLEGVEMKVYNPLHHVGGFHQKINHLVLESSCFGLVNTASDFSVHNTLPVRADSVKNETAVPADSSTLKVAAFGDNKVHDDSEIVDLTQECQLIVGLPPKTNAMPSDPCQDKCIPEAWQQLIIGGVQAKDALSPEHSMGKLTASRSAIHRPLDPKISKILERLGNPKQIVMKASSPTAVSGIATNTGEMTESCLPALTDAADKGSMTINSLLKPSFLRLKRKLG